MKNRTGLVFLALILTALTVFFILINISHIERWAPSNSLKRADFENVYDNGDIISLIDSLENSLRFIKKTSKQKFIYGRDIYSREDMIESLEDFSKTLISRGLSSEFNEYIKKNYVFYESSSKSVLFTGYFEAELEGSPVRTKIFKYPLYSIPDDLVYVELKEFSLFNKFPLLPSRITGRLKHNKYIVPYFNRMEIDTFGMLDGKDLEIAWVKDRISLFFLHIQGSGIITFPDGTLQRVNYAGSNGHPYRAIGRYLVEKGVCSYKDLSMQLIERYLRENPKLTDEIFNYNPSFVFFRKVTEGPVGSLGVPVTPFRSIATDNKLFPPGSICYISTELPVFNDVGKMTGFRPFNSFIFNQDTGGAIKTPSRADIFCGHGKINELIAGHLKSKGKLFFLIKKKIKPN